MANDLTLIGNAGANCSNTPYYEIDGCVNCVPYKKFLPLSDCACPSDVTKYINLETGELTTTEPTGFTIGACGSECASPTNTSICYQFAGGGCPPITTGVNGAYNGVDYALPSQIGARIELAVVEVDGVRNTLPSPILISSNSPTLAGDEAYFAAEFKAKVLPFYAAKVPQLNEVTVTFGNFGPDSKVVYFWMYDSTNPTRSYVGTCADGTECGIGLILTTNGVEGGANYGGGYEDEQLTIADPSCSGGGGTGTTVNIKVVTVNGVTTYYEEGVEVTNTTRIAEIQALIAAATAADVSCCSECIPETVEPVDSKVCFQIGADKYTVITVNGTSTYYKNDVLLTVAADITAAETAVNAATYADVIDCVEATVPPNTDICYEFTGGGGGGDCPTITADVSGFQITFRIDDVPGATLTLATTELDSGVETPVTPPILISNSAPTLAASLESLAAEFKSKVLSRYQTQQPWLDSVIAFEQVNSQGRLTLSFFLYASADLNKDYTGLCDTPPCEPYVKIATNGVTGGGNIGDPVLRTGIQIPDPACSTGGGTGTTTSIKAVTVNGTTTYYENGTAVTSATRIAEI